MKTIINRTTILASSFALTLAVTSIAAAGDHGRGKDRGAHMFDRLDTNKDGVVSREEAKKAADERFSRLDTNKDGAITEAEVKAAHEQRRAEWAKKHEDKTGEKSASKDKPRHGKRHGHGKGFFAHLDANKDGKVTRAEAAQLETERFNRMDANNDGKITREEAKVAHDAMKKKWQEKKERKTSTKA